MLVSDALLGLGMNMISVVLGRMGAAVVAANAICQVIDRLCTVVIGGVSNASGIITGNTIGAGDTRFLMVADILFLWLVSVPLGWVGGLVLHWPAWAAMLCLRADYIIKSFWCLSRLKSGKWIHEADGVGRVRKA